MKFYAYIRNKAGGEPTGTEDKLIFHLKTRIGAIRRARRLLGNNICVFEYQNFYDESITQIF